MHIYLIKRTQYEYDEYDAFVVVANDPDHVRRIVAKRVGLYDDWTSAKIKKVGEATASAKAGIVLGSFNAG